MCWMSGCVYEGGWGVVVCVGCVYGFVGVMCVCVSVCDVCMCVCVSCVHVCMCVLCVCVYVCGVCVCVCV